jgi:hypothetical protein
MQGFMRDGQLLEKQELDKMYVHSTRVLDPFLLFLAATFQLSWFKEDTMSYAPYADFCVSGYALTNTLGLLGNYCMGTETGLARDYSAHHPRCRALFARAWHREEACGGS